MPILAPFEPWRYGVLNVAADLPDQIKYKRDNHDDEKNPDSHPGLENSLGDLARRQHDSG
jgi:hypothetical protein